MQRPGPGCGRGVILQIEARENQDEKKIRHDGELHRGRTVAIFTELRSPLIFVLGYRTVRTFLNPSLLGQMLEVRTIGLVQRVVIICVHEISVIHGATSSKVAFNIFRSTREISVFFSHRDTSRQLKVLDDLWGND